MTTSLPGSSREEADVTTPGKEGRPEGENPFEWLLLDRLRQCLDGIASLLMTEASVLDEKEVRRRYIEARSAALAAVVVSPPTPPDGWFTFGSHVDQVSWLALEFSDALDDCGLPLWERPIPVSPATPNGQEDELLDPCDRCGTGRSCIADRRCRKAAAPSPASPAETREGRERALMERAWDQGYDRARDFYTSAHWVPTSNPYHPTNWALIQTDKERTLKLTPPLAAASPAAVPLLGEEAP